MPTTREHIEKLEAAISVAVDKATEVLEMQTVNTNASVAKQYADVAKSLAEALQAARA